MTRSQPFQQPEGADARVCIFPQLSKTEGYGAVHHQTDLVEIPIACIDKVLEGEGITISSFVLVAWAVTLRCFTECQTAQLWVGNGIEALSNTSLDGLIDLLSIPIESESSLKSLCQYTKWTMTHLHRPGHAPCNVGIIFQKPVVIDCPTTHEDENRFDDWPSVSGVSAR
ncbi:nonribosomal peptide synthase [Penicillium soppii]|uniref:nonribosomal peptide synthase n=1 Tax=Penicillium soppii TaxID=69789 RepID=UPI002547A0F7|nr:nonribosomal peptide synthase [Penicillium soppii]KAJ5882100.1 nonribosomal peptide synthase [Penicillium soppii]